MVSSYFLLCLPCRRFPRPCNFNNFYASLSFPILTKRPSHRSTTHYCNIYSISAYSFWRSSILARFKVTAIPYKIATRAAEFTRVRTPQNSHYSKARNAVLVTWSREVRTEKFFLSLEACNLVTATVGWYKKITVLATGSSTAYLYGRLLSTGDV
jgi:hypothetical protein